MFVSTQTQRELEKNTETRREIYIDMCVQVRTHLIQEKSSQGIRHFTSIILNY